jgi:hypothetical protein
MEELAQIRQISPKKKEVSRVPDFCKEELWKQLKKYFTTQKYNLQKILPKKIQNSSRYYYNSIITNTRQVPTMYQGIF